MILAFVIILSLLVVTLLAKQIAIKKELKEISIQLKEILNSDTNANITVSTGDKDIKKAVSLLNSSIRDLRKKELLIKSRNDEISTAITNVSHDLRTPLTAIIGYNDLICDSTSMEEIKQYSTIIGERARTLGALTQELFRYSLILSNDEIQTQTLCLQDELEKALVSNYTLLSQKGITPKISLSQIPITRNLNSQALERIFTNIFSNAAKYSDGDLYITLFDSGVIEIKNTAKGLDEVQVSKLFDRFYTVSNGRESTGIGLSISKFLTQEMGGSISASYKSDMLTICIDFKQ